jgi:hypothetical protein
MLDYYLIESILIKYLRQEKENNLCAFYVREFIHISTSERCKDFKQFEEMLEKLLPKDCV